MRKESRQCQRAEEEVQQHAQPVPDSNAVSKDGGEAQGKGEGDQVR